jgi:methenyltetrahydromethanopterin cyclohydrolase
VVDDEEIAYGRVNDCLIYGQETNVYVRCSDDKIKSILDELPFEKNKDVYGIQFQELFANCDQNWANVPRDWDAPCKVNFINLSSGNVFSTGKISYDVLEKSFLGE